MKIAEIMRKIEDEKCKNHANIRITPEEVTELMERDTAKAPSVKINNEAVKIGAVKFCKGTKVYRCQNCKRLVAYRDRFCSYCGQKLKWEE